MIRPKTSNWKINHGFTLLEVLLILSIFGILSSVGVYSLLNLRSPARDTARTVHSALMQLRSSAATNTQARRMVLNSDQTLSLQSSLSCSEADQSKWTTYETAVQLPDRIRARPVTFTNNAVPLSGPNVIVCFTPRGQASASANLTVADSRSSYTVQVALAGGVKTSAP